MICTHSPKINRMTKGMRGTGKVACTGGQSELHTRFWQGDQKEREHLQILNVDIIILKWTFKKSVGWVWTRFISLRIETSGGFF
jgi:hypothetical protein